MRLSDFTPFKCLHCNTMLSRTNGRILLCCSFELHSPVILHCASCGKPRAWEPMKHPQFNHPDRPLDNTENTGNTRIISTAKPQVKE